MRVPMLDNKKTKKQLLEELAKERNLISQLEESENKLAKKIKSFEEGNTLFKAIFERAAIGITLTAPDHRLIEANNTFQKMLGYSRQELVGMLVSDITHPEDNVWEEDLRKNLYQLKEKRIIEKRFIRKDGSTIWVQLAISPVLDDNGLPKYAIGMSEDITNRKKAEEQVLQDQEQLRRLATEISLAEERVRKRMAVHLHNQIIQTLSLSMLRLEDLQHSYPLPPFVVSLGEIRDLLQEVIEESRAMILDLSPPILEDLGLAAAVEWLADRMRERHNLETKILDDGSPKLLNVDVRDFVFRSIQELLINVVKHAQTDRAEISMVCQNGVMIINVKDEGLGFKTLPRESKWIENGAFGLFSIRERLKHLGGRLEIIKKSRRGAHIQMVVPLKI